MTVTSKIEENKPGLAPRDALAFSLSLSASFGARLCGLFGLGLVAPLHIVVVVVAVASAASVDIGVGTGRSSALSSSGGSGSGSGSSNG